MPQDWDGVPDQLILQSPVQAAAEPLLHDGLDKELIGVQAFGAQAGSSWPGRPSGITALRPAEERRTACALRCLARSPCADLLVSIPRVRRPELPGACNEGVGAEAESPLAKTGNRSLTRQGAGTVGTSARKLPEGKQTVPAYALVTVSIAKAPEQDIDPDATDPQPARPAGSRTASQRSRRREPRRHPRLVPRGPGTPLLGNFAGKRGAFPSTPSGRRACR